MIIGEIQKESGNIEILGKSIPEHVSQVKRLIGVVPDHQNLYDRITVRQNLEFFAELHEIGSDRIDFILEKVFLLEHQHKAAINLSRGLRQRALIARALLHKPQVFFLDEPTSALDPNSALLIRELIRELQNQGTTVLLTTHYMEEADSLCNRLAIMHKGNIVALDTAENLKQCCGKSSLVIEFEKDEKRQRQEFQLNSPAEKEKAAKILSNEHIISIHSQEPTLEKVFLKFTGAKWDNAVQDEKEVENAA
jgi:ABC-2 type transport system ATP-binding protein